MKKEKQMYGMPISEWEALSLKEQKKIIKEQPAPWWMYLIVFGLMGWGITSCSLWSEENDKERRKYYQSSYGSFLGECEVDILHWEVEKALRIRAQDDRGVTTKSCIEHLAENEWHSTGAMLWVCRTSRQIALKEGVPCNELLKKGQAEIKARKKESKKYE